MQRRWRPFDRETINRELLSLPKTDFLSLTAAMRGYRRNTGKGYLVKSYGGGLLMVRDASHGQGRCLFFAVQQSTEGVEILTALLVYKKESDEVPERVMRTARGRMKEFQ